jgi:hypothetical protein
MKTSWERDEGYDQRTRLELDPWEVRLHEGYHPLYDYSSTLVTTHGEWPESALRRRALEVLSEDIVREADASVAGAASIEPFAKWKAADDLHAAAWAKVPIEALVVDAQTPRAVRAEYGVPLTVEGVHFQWVGPATPRDVSCHLAPFDPPVRLYGLTAVAAVPGAFVFLRKESLPYVTTREGVVLPAISEHLAALGVEANGRSRVYASSAAIVGGSAVLRFHTQHHQRGASHATTGANWWVRVEPHRGVVSRSR